MRIVLAVIALLFPSVSLADVPQGTPISVTSLAAQIAQSLVVPGGIPTASAVTSVSSSSYETLFTAGSRFFYRISNNNPAGGYDLGCTDDGSTPTSSNYTIRVYASGSFEASRPSFVSTAAIQCIGLSGTVPIRAEQF